MKMKNCENEAMKMAAEMNFAGDAVKEENLSGSNVAVLTYKNVERLKHEVAFHNPDHLNPDEMLNHILDQYFRMVEEVRKTS